MKAVMIMRYIKYVVIALLFLNTSVKAQIEDYKGIRSDKSKPLAWRGAFNPSDTGSWYKMVNARATLTLVSNYAFYSEWFPSGSYNWASQGETGDAYRFSQVKFSVCPGGRIISCLYTEKRYRQFKPFERSRFLLKIVKQEYPLVEAFSSN